MHSKIFHKSINIRNILDGNITIPTSLAVRTTWNVFKFPISLLDHILLFHFQMMKVRIVRCRCILLIYLLTYSIKYLYFKYTKQHMVLFLKEMHYKKNNVSRITFMHSFLSVHQDRSTKKEEKKKETIRAFVTFKELISVRLRVHHNCVLVCETTKSKGFLFR